MRHLHLFSGRRATTVAVILLCRMTSFGRPAGASLAGAQSPPTSTTSQAPVAEIDAIAYDNLRNNASQIYAAVGSLGPSFVISNGEQGVLQDFPGQIAKRLAQPCDVNAAVKLEPLANHVPIPARGNHDVRETIAHALGEFLQFRRCKRPQLVREDWRCPEFAIRRHRAEPIGRCFLQPARG